MDNSNKKLAVQLKHVTKNFGNKIILKNISLDIVRGESTIILGNSGSGKSVMLKCILGLIPIDSGSVRINNFNSTRSYSSKDYVRQDSIWIQRKASILFQRLALFNNFLVWENIAFPLLHLGLLNKMRARSFSLSKLSKVKLPIDVADRYPNELSDDMQRRVALARTIAFNPSIVFFDEPTSGLDPLSSYSIDNLILSYMREINATTIIATHDIASVRRTADYVVMIKNGEIIWQTDARDIFN